MGDYTLTEETPDPETDGNWEHGYVWSDLACELDDDSLADDALELATDDTTGAIDEATLAVAAAQDISCTYTNTALEPQLEVSTSSDPADGEAVEPGDLITYSLTFDNAEGTAQVAADHVNHLRDVLDDADLVEGSLVDGGLNVTPETDRNNPRLLITGTVPAGETRTVEFQVRVKPHDQNLDERKQSQDGQHGYTLNHYLTERLDPNGVPIDIPDTCEDNEQCSSHPVPAWTVEKGSRPAAGARLNRGGNTHYVLTATKLNAATQVDELIFVDDLTHVFKTAGWAPDAEVPGGARSRGIYFVDVDGNTLDQDGEVNGTADDPSPAYGPERVGEPEQVGERWILESDPVDVPENAVNAELWFAVEAGQNPADIPASADWQGPNAPQNGWQYVNYVAAGGADSQPVQCGIDAWTDGVPDVTRKATEDPVDDSVAEACRTQHELNAGHFTVRKDAVGTGIDVPNGAAERDTYGDSSTGLWNLVNHEFEIHDDLDGTPSKHPSQYLCRTDYHPVQDWDGEFTAHPGDRSLDDWGADTGGNSETLDAIREHNKDVIDPDDALPECALFYPQPAGSGGQTGRYRGENFQPVLEDGIDGDPRDFWLNETAAPTHQISLNGQQIREVPGIQKLAEPIAFRIWPDQDGQHHAGPIFYGKRQLDVRDGEGFLDRCEPGASAHERDVACVNPTGYLMLVQDTVPMRLPLTGGNWLGILTAIGLGLVLVALSGTWWYRQRKNSSTRS